MDDVYLESQNNAPHHSKNCSRLPIHDFGGSNANQFDLRKSELAKSDKIVATNIDTQNVLFCKTLEDRYSFSIVYLAFKLMCGELSAAILFSDAYLTLFFSNKDIAFSTLFRWCKRRFPFSFFWKQIFETIKSKWRRRFQYITPLPSPLPVTFSLSFEATQEHSEFQEFSFISKFIEMVAVDCQLYNTYFTLLYGRECSTSRF